MSCIVNTPRFIILGCLVAFSLVQPLPTRGTGRRDEAEPTLEEVRQHIEDMGYCWTAGHTSVSELPPGAPGGLGGARLPEDYDLILKRIRNRPPSFALIDLPQRFDWGDSSIVPPIREQLCGDCWAQSVTAAMECQLRLRDRDTTALAVQYVIDCNFGGSTCGGGFLEDACYLFSLLGAISEECYPYLGAPADCNCDTCEIVAKLSGYEYIDTTVVSLKTHLMTDGPIPVCMTVPPDLQYYEGGCYESEVQGPYWHGLTIIGWDDSMCAGQGAWHLWNSSGTGWGEDGFAWIKCGTCSIGAGAMALHYDSQGPVRPAVDNLTIEDSSGDSDGVADPGEAVVLVMEASNNGWLTATGVSVTLTTTTAGITVTTAVATFPDIEPGASLPTDSPHLAFSVESEVLCGTPVRFTASIACDQGTFADDFELIVGDAETAFFDDAESDLGWNKGLPGDDATTGRWRRRNPVGTEADSILVQPEFDHTPGSAVRCFVTSNTIRNLAPATADVDGGRTTLLSPPIDLSDRASAFLRYWRWYTNDTGGSIDDAWLVDASPDSGMTWLNLETDTASTRSWVRKEFDLHHLIGLTDKVVLRFTASDYGEESVVEAAVDDIEVLGCPYTADTAPPAVVLLSPNGGEEVTEGTLFEITWAAADNYGIRDMLVLASYDSGTAFVDTLGSTIWPDTTLSWLVPAGEYNHCRILVEVTDRGYNAASDTSDSTFAIVPDLSGIEEHNNPVAEVLGGESNPVTGSTRIFFTIPTAGHVRMSIYDVEGRLVAVLLDGDMNTGHHFKTWDGRSVSGAPAAPGVYFVHLATPGTRKTAKMILIR